MNPKTGSHTIEKVFKDIPVTRVMRDHANYEIGLDAYELPEFNTYKFYCFYRDPVERFNSGFKFYKRNAFVHLLETFISKEDSAEAMKQVKKGKYDRFLFMQARYNDEYTWLTQDLRDKIESVTVSQLLNHFTYEKINEIPTPMEVYRRAFQKTPSPFVTQRFWLDHNIDLTLLNFANFENNLRSLTELFGVTLDTIPHENITPTIENDHVLTTEEIALIKQFYQSDYDFFASKGITFN